MIRYETLILTTPHLTSDEGKMIEEGIVNLANEAKGSIISFERWGKFKLAYPVRKNDYGIYFLVRFELATTQKDGLLETMQAFLSLKHGALVMRYLTTRLDEKKSLEYQRPESLEDIPSRDVDTFLRENKMEGLLSSEREPTVNREAAETGTGQRDSQDTSAISGGE